MDAALTPREIQSRIRAGQSVDELAADTGMTLAQIEPFAVPVIAERAWFANEASRGLVRREGVGTNQSLLELIGDRLAGRGISTADISWDAWRGHDRLWTLRASYYSGSSLHEAVFRYDPVGRFSQAVNDEARWLVGEASSARGPQRRSPAREPVNVDAEPTLDMASTQLAPESRPVSESIIDFEPGDFADAELTQVDGVYDLVSGVGAGMDVLYDMLASINEESVRIYDGLTGASSSGQRTQQPKKSDGGATRLLGKIRAQGKAEPEPEPELEPELVLDPFLEVEPQLPALNDESKQPTVRIPKSKKRVAVPTWDEIMFGSPQV